MKEDKNYYTPSNGTEGCGFVENFCAHCIHEKFMHTQNDNDLKCEILTTSFLNWPDPVEEWVYDENEQPTCTAYKKWDWGRDDEDGFNEPPEIPPDDPNQLCLPFIFDELNIKKQELQTT